MNRNTRRKQKRARATTAEGARKIKDGVFEISRNDKRNTRQVVYHCANDAGVKVSVTGHEPIDNERPYRGVAKYKV